MSPFKKFYLRSAEEEETSVINNKSQNDQKKRKRSGSHCHRSSSSLSRASSQNIFASGLSFTFKNEEQYLSAVQHMQHRLNYKLQGYDEYVPLQFHMTEL